MKSHQKKLYNDLMGDELSTSLSEALCPGIHAMGLICGFRESSMEMKMLPKGISSCTAGGRRRPGACSWMSRSGPPF